MTFKTQHHYKISLELTVDGETLKKEDDINYCSFLRAPICKMATLCIVRASLPQDTIDKYVQALSRHDFEKNLEVLLTITSHDAHENHLDGKDGDPIFKRKYKCVGIDVINPIDNTSNNTACHLLLVNKMIHFLSTVNAYNKVLGYPESSLTAVEALQKFEEWVTSNYGDFVNFQKVGTDMDQSDFLYEQMLINAPNDLNVPNHIINSFKTHNIFTSYFWDDFVISDSNIAHKEVCAWHLNFNNVDDLKELDIMKHGDMSQLSKHVKDIPHADILNDLHASGETCVINLGTGVFGKIPASKLEIAKKEAIKTETINVTAGDREGLISTLDNKDVETMPFDTTIMSKTFYAPDDEEHAKERLEQTKLLFEKIDRFVEFKIGPCYPDFPQFGQKYNLNYHLYEDSVKEFKFTPLNICNTFIRKADKEPWLTHSVRTLMIQYKV